MEGPAATTSRPRLPATYSRMRRWAWSTLPASCSARRRNSTPTAVSATWRVVRSNSRAPSVSSRRLTAALSAGCDRWLIRAASLKLRVEASARKISTWRKVIFKGSSRRRGRALCIMWRDARARRITALHVLIEPRLVLSRTRPHNRFNNRFISWRAMSAFHFGTIVNIPTSNRFIESRREFIRFWSNSLRLIERVMTAADDVLAALRTWGRAACRRAGYAAGDQPAHAHARGSGAGRRGHLAGKRQTHDLRGEARNPRQRGAPARLPGRHGRSGR